MDAPFVKEELESIRHLQYSNVVNSVGMLRQANIICDRTNDATQAFIIYKNMAIPGILERFYRKMQNRLGIMMTRADVTSISDRGDRVVVSCENTLLGMDFDLDVDHGVVLPLRHCANHSPGSYNKLAYRQGRIFLILRSLTVLRIQLHLLPIQRARGQEFMRPGCVRQPMTMDGCMEDAAGAVLQRPSSVLKLETTACLSPQDLATSPTPCSISYAAPSASAAPRNVHLAPLMTMRKARQSQILPAAGVVALFWRLPERGYLVRRHYSIDQISSMIREVAVPKDFKKEGPRILDLGLRKRCIPCA